MNGSLLNLTLLAPELILTVFFGAILFVGLWSANPKHSLITALTGVTLALLATLQLYHIDYQHFFSEMASHDPFSLFFRLLFLLTTFVILLYSYFSHEVPEKGKFEFYLLLYAVTIGMSMLATSINVLMLYLALELTSVPSYVLAGFRKNHYRSNEAAFKYLIYGAFSSGLLLFGLSLLFGMTRSLNIYDMQLAWLATPAESLTVYAIIFMIFGGIAFKISSFPFHMWTPDVYEGAPTPATAFFSIAPKAAGFAFLIRFFYTTFAAKHPEAQEWGVLLGVDWPTAIAVVSALTMTIGNLGALAQNNVKRMLAYSSIAHAGYLLMGFVTLNIEGLSAMMFYLIVYYLMKLGAFVLVGVMSGPLQSEDISAYKGLGWRSPFMAVIFAIFLLSLTGIPPFGGFIGKVYLFAALVKKEIYWLVIVGILNSVISLFYYARILKAMFFEEGPTTAMQYPIVMKILLLLLAVPTIVLGIYWEPVVQWIRFTVLQLIS